MFRCAGRGCGARGERLAEVEAVAGGEDVIGVKVAERIRMLGERTIGVLHATDGDVLRETYDWGFKMGRDHAAADPFRRRLVQGHRPGRRPMTATLTRAPARTYDKAAQALIRLSHECLAEHGTHARLAKAGTLTGRRSEASLARARRLAA